MEHFLDTIETIGEGYGFPLFGARHLITLAVFLAFTAGSCILYGRADKAGRGKMRKLFAILLLAAVCGVMDLPLLLRRMRSRAARRAG